MVDPELTGGIITHPIYFGKTSGSPRMSWKVLLKIGPSKLSSSTCFRHNQILDKQEMGDGWMDVLLSYHQKTKHPCPPSTCTYLQMCTYYNKLWIITSFIFRCVSNKLGVNASLLGFFGSYYNSYLRCFLKKKLDVGLYSDMAQLL